MESGQLDSGAGPSFLSFAFLLLLLHLGLHHLLKAMPVSLLLQVERKTE